MVPYFVLFCCFVFFFFNLENLFNEYRTVFRINPSGLCVVSLFKCSKILRSLWTKKKKKEIVITMIKELTVHQS